MGNLIKLTDKGFIREHPFGNPVDFPASGDENNNAFIYPGDELTMWFKVTLPDDVSAAAIGHIFFQSARASIIAQKPQVFSEVFSKVFKSTRSFTLDSFVTAFNNSNAPIQPWGADGYAPNLHLAQDRGFILPAGDFHRQIKIFTQHTASTSSWDYWFYFPILFRWEEWISLSGVSDDFFNLAQLQEGKNNWWYHYFVANVWRIVSRLEINCLILGEQTVIRCDLNLTPSGQGGVKTYSSNADYINKSIKTASIGGTPSDSPAFIYGNKDTRIIAEFEKDHAWDSGERNQISGLVWIEPYQGAGVTARTRGSSSYAATTESVFKGLGIAATDNDGLQVGNTGSWVVFDSSGTGAKVVLNATSISRLQIFAVLDYTRLAVVYPGVTKFTIYTRLYNNMKRNAGVNDNTRNGEELRLDVTMINPPTSNALCEPKQPPCPFNLTVFADLVDSDDLKNDKSDFLAYGDPSVADIFFVLGKMTDCATPAGGAIGGSPPEGDFNDDFSDDFFNDENILTPATIPQTFEEFIDGFTGTLTMGDCVPMNITLLNAVTDQQWGKYFPFGKSHDFLGNNFIDDYGKKYTGLLLEWRKVMQQYGEGNYQIYIVKVDVFGNAKVECDPRTFCLKNYHCNFANGTVRIEVTNEGFRGLFFDPENPVDYAGGWYGQYRLKGVLKYKQSDYTDEYNQYGDSKRNAYKPVIDEQTPKFILALKPVPGWMDFILSTTVLQGDEILITDYNINNRHPLTQIPVKKDGSYQPRDTNLSSPLADVRIDMAHGSNRMRRRNSR